jgi:hypothetical protein
MLRIFSIVFTMIFSLNIFAAEVDCKSLDKVAKDSSWHRPYLGEVIGKGRAQFYSAPNYKCPIKDKFIIKGNGVGIYSTFGKWSQIIYPAGTEEDSGVWILTSRLKVLSRPEWSGP